jgi:hypothetical protein
MKTEHRRKGGQVRPLRIAHRHPSFVTCSVCLRVLRGADWLEAGHLIRSLRTFDHVVVPRLRPALCDYCADELRQRREPPREPLAA